MLTGNGEEATQHAWVCPSDRQLTLRSKLRAGWSVRAAQNERQRRSSTLSDEELKKIRQVIERAENMDQAEQKRVGKLVHRLDDMRNNSAGDGKLRCILCAEAFGKLMGASSFVCVDCKKNVCSKCSVEFPTHLLRGSRSMDSNRGRSSNRKSSTTKWLCKICSEGRELWKRSGAWFFQSLPRYILPEQTSNGMNQNFPIRTLGSTIIPQSPGSPMHKPTKDFATTPTSAYTQHKYMVRRRSSSSESSDSSDISSFGKPASLHKKSDSASITSSTSYTNSNDASSRRSEQILFEPNSARSNGFAALSGSENSLNVPGGARKRRISGTRNRQHKKSVGDKSIEDIGTSNPDMWSLHSSGVDGGSYIVETNAKNEIVTENTAGLGSLEFTLLHDSHKLALYVTVIRARGLKAMDINGFSDPYVKLHLLPGSKKLGESTKMRTKTKQKTLNPTFDETLTYWGITDADIQKKTLRLTVLDEDRLGDNEFIGEVRIQLKNFNLTQTNAYNMGLTEHQDIKEDEDGSERGRIMVTLSYQPRDTMLIATINRCSSLLPVARTNTIDPQVKLCLKSEANPSEFSFKKTERRKNTKTSNPAFNETMKLPLPAQARELVNCSLDVSVWDKDTFGKEHLIGAVCFGIHSKGDKLKQWFNCVKKPHEAHEMWHSLTLPNDPEKISSLAEAGRRSRTPRFHRKLHS
ncbi:rabphilin-3A isoform X2 [Ciona intestinalis]